MAYLEIICLISIERTNKNMIITELIISNIFSIIRKKYSLFIFVIFHILLFSESAALAQHNSTQEKKHFRQNIPWMCQLKLGFSDDRLTEESFVFGSFRFDYRIKPIDFSFLDLEYVQFQFPASLYYFKTDNSNTFAIDFRIRPELGPPANSRIPLFFPELGYLYFSSNWFAGSDKKDLHALLIGRMVRFPIQSKYSAVVEVSGQISLTGEKFARYSCYMHWFVSEHFGFTIHGDVFPSHKLFDGEGKGYGAMLLGLVIK